MNALTAIVNYKKQTFRTGHVKIMGDTPDSKQEEQFGWAYMSATSDTGWKYEVVVTPIGSEEQAAWGGSHLVTLVSPHKAAYVLNPFHLRCSFVGEKFAPPSGEWNAADLVCVTRTIALAMGVSDDADTAHEYLDKP